ncbi:MAG: CcmD family protein [Chloroflexi bacterium]|nr:CcmD family protein [Chloroflexota bacterium]
MENNLPFLVAALGVTWLGIIAYLLFLSSRLSALRRELASLERQHDWSSSEDDNVEEVEHARTGGIRPNVDARANR